MKSREELFGILHDFSLINNPSAKTIEKFISLIIGCEEGSDEKWNYVKDKILKFVNHEFNVSVKRMNKFTSQFDSDIVKDIIDELIGEKMIYTATNHKGMSYWSKARFEREFNN